MTVDVLMLQDEIRLFAIAHTLHILMRHLCKFAIRKTVIRMRIERDMDDGLFCPHLPGHVTLKVRQDQTDVHTSCALVEYLVGVKELTFSLVHLVGIVLDDAEEAAADSYLCDHRSCASLASMTICCPCSII